MSEISLQNRMAIHELIAEYSHHVDNYRGEAWANLFVEEGKLLGIPNPMIGRQAFIDKALELRNGEKEYRHSITNVYLEPGATNELAVARAYGLVSDWAKAPPVIAMFVEYRFEVINRNDDWKIMEMHVHRPYKN